MLVPVSWLRDFAPIDGDVDQLVAVCDDLGLVVEGVERVGEGLDDILVARVLGTRKHPDADKVQLVDVDAGDGEALQVVCGAFNFGAGDLVPLAPVGSVLPGGMEIGRRRMRGEWSNGMLCSARELRLSADHGGIMVLGDGAAEPGTPLKAALGLEVEVVLDLAIEANRPDAMSIAGVARDVAARMKVPFAIPQPTVGVADGGPDPAVEVETPDLCPRFSATVVPGVTVGPSPTRLARRLTLAGMRPLNNVVDASNYVMLELGQPTHPYDRDLLPGGGLRVRAARPGERLVTLDDVERELGRGPYADCVICDGDDTAIGIAGVMGGASSEISPATTDVLLEAAHFNAMAIARTSKRLGLRSEASARFERGSDPGALELAADRFVELLGAARGPQTVAGAPPERLRVAVRTARVNAILGTEVSDADIADYLEPIGFDVEPTSDGVQRVAVPTYRPDCSREIDVIEEVARHHGYSAVDRTMPPVTRVGALNPYQRDRRLVRQALVGAGCTEAITLSLLAPGDLERAGLPGEALELSNPLAREESVLRTSLLPGLLKAIAYNVDRRNPDVRLFEIGRVYAIPEPGAALPDEHERLAVALAGEGADAPAAVRVWEVLAEALRLERLRLDTATIDGLHPTRSARIAVPDATELGAVGEVDPEVLRAHGIDGRVGWLDVDLGTLLRRAPRRPPVARPLSRYPSSDVDLAFEVDETVPAADVEATLWRAGRDLLTDVRLFDVYRGPQVADGRRSLAYRLRFESRERTLTDDDVADARRRCIEAVESSLPASLRG